MHIHYGIYVQLSIIFKGRTCILQLKLFVIIYSIKTILAGREGTEYSYKIFLSYYVSKSFLVSLKIKPARAQVKLNFAIAYPYSFRL